MTSASSALAPGDRAVVAVQAATLWTAPRLHRPGIDDAAVSAPTDLDAWNRAMPETPERRWLLGKLETQALLGTLVLIDEIDGDWARIVVPEQSTGKDERGYPGWVPVEQIVVDTEFARLAGIAPTATVTALRAPLTATPTVADRVMEASFDTVLPVLDEAGETIRVAVPGARTAHLRREDVVVRRPGEQPPTPTVEDLITTGERFLDLRYLWAGVSAYGFDCSGFTYALCRHHGIRIARDAGDQMRLSGLSPVEQDALQRGDLVFFATSPGAEEIRHVALFIGDGRIMHAPNAERSIEVISLEEYDQAGEYAGARRILAS